MVLIGEDNAEPAWCGAEEGLAAAQNHLVFEEMPPKTQLILKRGLRQVLPGQKECECDSEVRTEISAAPTYLSEVRPDEHGRGPVHVRDVQTM